MKNNVLSVACVLCMHVVAYAMEKPELRVLRGDVFIVPRAITELDSLTKQFSTLYNQDGTELVMPPKSCYVEVRTLSTVTQKEWITKGNTLISWYDHYSENWATYGHPYFDGVFTSRLPYAWLKDKKEGDELTCYYKNKKTQEVFKVVLTCMQLVYPYSNGQRFEGVLQGLEKNAESSNLVLH